MEEFDFRKWQAKRDASTALLGVGGLLLLASLALLVLSFEGGHGLQGWFVYFLGPGTLLPSIPMLAVGGWWAKKAQDTHRP